MPGSGLAQAGGAETARTRARACLGSGGDRPTGGISRLRLTVPGPQSGPGEDGNLGRDRPAPLLCGSPEWALTDCVWDVEAAGKCEVFKICNTKGKSFLRV